MTRKLTDEERKSNAGKQARKARSHALERASKILDPHFTDVAIIGRVDDPDSSDHMAAIKKGNPYAVYGLLTRYLQLVTKWDKWWDRSL